MRRVSQVIGVAFALALSLVPDRVEATERGHQLQVETRSLADAAWLPLLEDPALDVGQRLALTVSDPDFLDWFGRSLMKVAPMTPTQAVEEIQLSETSRDPVLRTLLEGLRALEEGQKLLPFDGIEEIEGMDEFVFEPEMLEESMALLTSPEVPEIIGDELQYLAEAVVAVIGAALLEERNPDLALDLARAFVERANRVPRLIVLLAIWKEFESELRPHDELVTSLDRLTLANDMARADRSVANLRRLAELGQTFRS